ncbi:MAG: hypothetical protein MK213_06215, partial [Planctomycetes bacterium]|nr:hypothetical protein [Planctomycetota bacterium]
GVYKLDYELPLGSESQGEWGVWRESRATAFLTPSWLAYPIPLDGTPLMGVVQPPSWTLSATVPATEQGLSWCPPTTDTIQGSEAGRKLIWPRHPKNQSWPFLLTGPYLPAQVGGLTLHLRPGAKSSRTLPAAAWLASLFDSAQSQYQGSRRTPMIATFPNCGDRIFPGLWILDESQKWLGASLDEAHGLLNRRVGFAELLGTSLFGGEVRGKGSARPFLEISLAEYVAMRLLENSLHPELADRLKETWREHDRSSGPLQQPLSLTERSDLEGPKRLLSTGPLTYLHIESMVGRPAFDLILRQALHSQALWTTEDLRTSLEASSDHDWKSFFDQHIYGRVPLPTLPITPPK